MTSGQMSNEEYEHEFQRNFFPDRAERLATAKREGQHLARSYERLQKLEHSPPLRHEENLATLRWAKQWIWGGLLNSNIKTHAHFVRELQRCGARERERERIAIRVHWRQWNARGLQWKERQSEMVKFGFRNFATMPITTFKSMCVRKLGLKYRPEK
jgi:hypothetical protein